MHLQLAAQLENLSNQQQLTSLRSRQGGGSEKCTVPPWTSLSVHNVQSSMIKVSTWHLVSSTRFFLPVNVAHSHNSFHSTDDLLHSQADCGRLIGIPLWVGGTLGLCTKCIPSKSLCDFLFFLSSLASMLQSRMLEFGFPLRNSACVVVMT
jgi:hypothetical protein